MVIFNSYVKLPEGNCSILFLFTHRFLPPGDPFCRSWGRRQCGAGWIHGGGGGCAQFSHLDPGVPRPAVRAGAWDVAASAMSCFLGMKAAQDGEISIDCIDNQQIDSITGVLSHGMPVLFYQDLLFAKIWDMGSPDSTGFWEKIHREHWLRVVNPVLNHSQMTMVSPWFPADFSRLKALDQSVRHGSAAQESGMLHCNKGSTFRFVHVIVIVYV